MFFFLIYLLLITQTLEFFLQRIYKRDTTYQQQRMNEKRIRSFLHGGRGDDGLPKIPHQCGGKCWEIRPKPLQEDEPELRFVGRIDPETFRGIDPNLDDSNVEKRRPFIEKTRSFFSGCFADAAHSIDVNFSNFYSTYNKRAIFKWMRIAEKTKKSHVSYMKMRFILLIGALGKESTDVCLYVADSKDSRFRLLTSYHFRGESKALEEEHQLSFFGRVDPNSFKPIEGATNPPYCDDYRFDIRTKWPQCAEIISKRHDQGNCDCCYAVAGASVLSDRYCIALAKHGWPIPSVHDASTFFSAADIMQCGRTITIDSCKGDFSYKVWRFLNSVGVVTGGCKPFPLMSNRFKYDVECQKKCENEGYPDEYSFDKIKTSTWHTLAQNVGFGWEQTMKDEIRNNGSLPVDIKVFRRFIRYDGGIHRHRDFTVGPNTFRKIDGYSEDGSELKVTTP